MRQCSRCHESVESDAQRCPHCGAWLSEQADSGESLEDAVRALLAQRLKIAAIKLYREQTGVGLAEAKDAVEHIAAAGQVGRGHDVPDSETTFNDLEKQVLELLTAGKKIQAIKVYRMQAKVGLKEAKDAVEALAAQNGIAPPPRSGCFAVVAAVLFTLCLSLVVIACSRCD